MAKSRSESLLRRAFSVLSLRGAEGDEAISKHSPKGKRTMPGPGINAIVFRHCEERSDEAISKRAA